MTDQQRALLAAIRANPDDDLVRLVYADWVEEQGDGAMAELIRCHVERERVELNSPQYDRLLSHSALLLAMNRDRWTAELRERFGVSSVEFVRGLPEEVTLTLLSFVAHSESLFATFPIRHVLFTDVESVGEVYRLPLPPNVRRSIAVNIPFDLERHLQWGFGENYGLYSLELLPQSPQSREAYLDVGRWLILCPAVWSGPDRQTETAFLRAFLTDVEEATQQRDVQLAIRRFDDSAEFGRWCPVPNAFSSPHWIELRNGRISHHRSGLELPDWMGPNRYYDDEN
jgi:uncharacterized protein (TIGR02996 family)